MTYKLEELREMIPIYLNRRLSAEETRIFEEGLEKYPELKKELMAFARIQQSYQNMEEHRPDSEALFARIQKNIDKSDARVADSGKFDFISKMRVFFANIYRTPAVSWSIAGLQFAAILLLVMVMPQDNVFKTYTSGGQTPEDRVRINVVFIQEAREVEIRDLLQEIGASIVAGPNAAGLYVLEIKKGPAVESSIKKLRQARFVRLAERSLSLRIQPAPVKRTGQRIMAGSAVRSPALGCS